MQKIFFEYHIRDKEIFDELLKNSTIILDTNSLLNLYRYSSENRPKFFEILTKIKERLILPYQVGYEFYENREQIIKSKSNFKTNLTDFLKLEINSLSNKIHSSSSNCKYSNSVALLKHEEKLRNDLINNLDRLLLDLINCVENHDNDISNEYIFNDDYILNHILELYEGKVNEKLADDKINKIYNEGKNRYENKIPPGYKDNHKPEPNKYGDLVLWNEIIEIAKNTKKNILFISDDRKEDWCHRFEGIDLGSRRELIREFHKETNCYFFSITTLEFIQQISTMYDIENLSSLKEETQIIKDNLCLEENPIYKMYEPDYDSIIKTLNQKKYFSNVAENECVDLIQKNEISDEDCFIFNSEKIDKDNYKWKTFYNAEPFNNENLAKLLHEKNNSKKHINKSKELFINLLKHENISLNTYIKLLEIIESDDD